MALTVVALLVGCHRVEEKPKAVVGPPWQQWQALLTGPSAGQSAPTLETLSARAKKAPPLKPYRTLSKSRALKDAERLLERAKTSKGSLEFIVPPVDWGAQPGKNRNAHMKRNDLRIIAPVVWAHFYTGEERYLAYVEHVLLDWIDFNLVKDKPNAMKWYDFATGIRSVVLAYVIDRRLRSQSRLQGALPELIWAANEHAKVLSRPHFLTDGNHGMYVVLGLKALVTALPELKKARTWAKYADSKMIHLLNTRYSKEGFHLEHSPDYHSVTNRSVGEIVKTKLFEIPESVRSKLERAKQVSYLLYHPNGDRPLVGDTARGAGKRLSDLPQHQAFLTSEGREGTAPASGLLAFPDVGYAFYRSSWDDKPFAEHSYLFFAPGFHSQHHKHADHLSFEWSEAGHPILVDSGKYEYAKNQWRTFFVSTRAGNAIEIDAKDHSTDPKYAWGGGLKEWGAQGALQFMNARVEYQPSRVSHSRTLVLYPKRWLCVVDELSAKEPHTYQQWLHLHESFEVEQKLDYFEAQLGDELRVFVQDLAPEKPQLELARGQVQPRIQGWLSADYRQKTRRYSLAFRLRGKKRRFVTLLSLGKRASLVHVDESPDGLRVHFALGATPYEFRVRGGKLVSK